LCAIPDDLLPSLLEGDFHVFFGRYTHVAPKSHLPGAISINLRVPRPHMAPLRIAMKLLTESLREFALAHPLTERRNVSLMPVAIVDGEIRKLI
jgi:hypothetical protein